ncbi:YbjQ family protein [Aliarcobacter butzleri]|uniref:YbjQ family protein n=1 Tax=Aliarcobacter butzleri TaxID=28197 RepID=UPI0021B2ABAA|nr:YbjQ family protein [Aliarcobacter butzleri]MCT7604834.1 YbjQ family protein [Aliarcobacter butzleri]
MGMCKECSQVFPADIMKDGYCPECLEKGKEKEESEKQKLLKLEALKNNKEILNDILITTETVINTSIEKRLGIVSSQCIYGINIIKDIFSFVRDIVGGRVNSIEKALEDANNEIIRDLKIKAYLQDANAVIGVRIEHTYNNANAGSILSVFATGTLIKLSK